MSKLLNASNVFLDGRNASKMYLNGNQVWTADVPSPTPSLTPSITPSLTQTPSISITPSLTQTPSISSTPSVSLTPSISQIISVTPSVSRTPSVTPSISRTPSVTPSISFTPSPTPSITPSTSVPANYLYSNFEQYIVGGVRQESTTALVRTNISITRRLIVTETITITGFNFVRIPPNNWSTLGYSVTGTLSVVAGTGATIDGGSSNKSFNTKSSVYNPSVVASRASTTSQYDIYDVRPNDNSTTTLTAGEYNIGLLGTGANMDLALMTNATFPIDTSKKIYPSTTAATTHLAMRVF